MIVYFIRDRYTIHYTAREYGRTYKKKIILFYIKVRYPSFASVTKNAPKRLGKSSNTVLFLSAIDIFSLLSNGIPIDLENNRL